MPGNQQGYIPKPALFAFDKVFLANQEFKDQAQFFADDCDVEVLALHGTKTGTYQLQLQDPSGRWISTSYINDTNCVGTAASPFVLPRSIVVPAKQKLTLNIKDTSGAGNTVQLVFVAIRRERP